MVFGTILYVSVLCLNAAAILNEERFLSRGEWGGSGPLGTVSVRMLGADEIRFLLFLPLSLCLLCVPPQSAGHLLRYSTSSNIPLVEERRQSLGSRRG